MDPNEGRDPNEMPDPMRASLGEALDALVRNEYPDTAPMWAWLEEHRAKAVGPWPDAWRHAVSHFICVTPDRVTLEQRLAVKHACFYLLHEPDDHEGPGTSPQRVIRDLLREMWDV